MKIEMDLESTGLVSCIRSGWKASSSPGPVCYRSVDDVDPWSIGAVALSGIECREASDAITLMGHGIVVIIAVTDWNGI